MVLQRRPVSTEEAAVIRAALARAATGAVAETVVAGIRSREVVDRCPCGCDSVQFAVPDGAPRAAPIADGVGKTPRGGQVGVLVFATGAFIKELEVYDLGAGDDDLRLPLPDSIRSWNDAAAV